MEVSLSSTGLKLMATCGKPVGFIWPFSGDPGVSHLLLLNKLPQNLETYNSTHLLSHRFCGSGIQV